MVYKYLVGLATYWNLHYITRQSVAVQREGGIPVGQKILHSYQGP